MNLFAEFETRVRAAVARLADEGLVPSDVDLSGLAVEPPRDAAHGDIATNAALALAKAAGQPPRVLAERIAGVLAEADDVASAQVAGPGFINLTLAPVFWPRVLSSILAQGAAYGTSTVGAGRRVNVEYVSANPTGPLHIGHCRGAVFGDALANLLAAAGYDVAREYYINDAGAQVDVLARSAFLRCREALGEDIGEIPAGLYPGDYLKPVGEALAGRYGRALLEMPEEEWLPLLREEAIAAMLAEIRTDLATLGIAHDVFFSERSLTRDSDAVGATVADLRARDLVYQGRLPPPKGKPPEDWEDREQTLFRATAFGDDVDRALMKSDGSYTYFAADMAYHRDKLARGFTELIDVLGADHGGYVKRMQAAVEALSGGKAALDVKICQLVKLFRDGEPVKMSKRAGDFVTLREVVDEVGPGPVRFMMLTRKNDAPLDFDFAKVQEQSRDNPVFYVQYAHARASSVLRNAAAEGAIESVDPDFLAGADFSLLGDESERTLQRRLAHYPRVVEAAARAHEPHRIAFYLLEVAGDFHALWNRGKDSPQLRFIHAGERELTRARIGLVSAMREVIASGLGTLGVQPIHEMR
jgi:arginyl-tRNA synthetase